MGNVAPHRTVSWTELQAFSRCRRKWFLHYVLRKVPKVDTPTDALFTGTLFHSWLEDYYKPQHLQEYQRDIWDMIGDRYIHDQEQARKTVLKVEAMSKFYKEWVEETDADKDLDIVDTELAVRVDQPFGFPAPKSKPVLCHVDMLANDFGGMQTIVEHKTTGYTHSVWVSSSYYALSWQVKFYTLILIEAGLIDPKKAQYAFNVVRSVKGGPTTAKPLVWRQYGKFSQRELEYAREVFARRIAELDRFERTTIQTGKYAYPEPNPTECSSCVYSIVCENLEVNPDRGEEMLQNFFRDRNEGEL